MAHEIPTEQRCKGAVITVSDRCSTGERDDRSGPLAAELLGNFGVEVADVDVVPDHILDIREAVERAAAAGAAVIVTTGGTGVMTRDVTPEAIEPLLATRLPGLEQQIVAMGLGNTPLAGLSRGIVGVTSKDVHGVVVVCAPGSTGGVRDAISVVGPLIGHLLDQLRGHSD